MICTHSCSSHPSPWDKEDLNHSFPLSENEGMK